MNILSTVLLIIQLSVTVMAIVRYLTVNRRASKWFRDELEKYTSDTEKMLNEFKDSHIERLNLLSKENAKLMEENQKYRDKLKNLGFTDVTLDN